MISGLSCYLLTRVLFDKTPNCLVLHFLKMKKKPQDTHEGSSGWGSWQLLQWREHGRSLPLLLNLEPRALKEFPLPFCLETNVFRSNESVVITALMPCRKEIHYTVRQLVLNN